MSVTGSGPYGVSGDGFLDLGALEEAAAGMPAAEFEEAYPVPGLLVELPDNAAGDSAADEGRDRRIMTLSLPSVDFLRYVGKFGLLVKRPGNPFPRMVCLGRAPTNDIVMDVRSISKFHGYFDLQDGAWCFTDRNSTNGSRRNGRPLAANTRCRLEAGDRLRFGLELEAVFLPPAELYRRLRRA